MVDHNASETGASDPGAFEPEAFDPDSDRLREECGVFGIFGHPDAAAITALGLHALQHRGQEAAGIVSYDGKRFNSERRMGMVADAFSKASTIERLPGEGRLFEGEPDARDLTAGRAIGWGVEDHGRMGTSCGL